MQFTQASRAIALLLTERSIPVTMQKDTDAASSTKSPRKNRNSGYNPAVALPAGMEVVGRSPSVKQKKKA